MIDYFQLTIILGSSLAGLLIIKRICYRWADTIDNYIYIINNVNQNNDNNEEHIEYDDDEEYSNDEIYIESDIEAPDLSPLSSPTRSDNNRSNILSNIVIEN